MRLGILTGGGDCPGLNAVIRAVVRKSLELGYEILGIKYGWRGLLEMETLPLDRRAVSGILHRGGTILGTSRTNPLGVPNGLQRIAENSRKLGLDVLVAVGGDDTLGVAAKLAELGVRIIGVPKTIDNDLQCTDYTFGFNTAMTIVAEALDRLHSTAEAHDRVFVIEVMGRDAGWIATYGGLAGGADYILIPEKPFTLDEVCESIQRRHAQGKHFSLIVVAEGAVSEELKKPILQSEKKDAFGHLRLGGIGEVLAKEIEERTGFETRSVVLGHLQRGGAPTPYDRILATLYGVKAVELAQQGRSGVMVALQGNQIVAVELAKCVASAKTVDMEVYKMAQTFFG